MQVHPDPEGDSQRACGIWNSSLYQPAPAGLSGGPLVRCEGPQSTVNGQKTTSEDPEE